MITIVAATSLFIPNLHKTLYIGGSSINASSLSVYELIFTIQVLSFSGICFPGGSVMNLTSSVFIM